MSKKSKINKRRMSISLIIFIILISLATLLKEKIEIITKVRDQELLSVGTIDSKWNENTNSKIYNNTIIVSDDEKVTSYNFNNTKNWHMNINKSNSIVHLGEEHIYILDKEKGNIEKINLDGELNWDYSTEYTIYTLAENEGHLFVYSRVNEDIRNITIINKDGKEIINQNKNKEEILSANISENKKKFIITSMDKKTPDLKTNLTYLDDKGEIIWKKELEDKIIYNILFLDNRKMILVGDKQIICIDDKENILWSKDLSYGLKDIKVSKDKKINILHGSDNSYLEVIDAKGETQYTKEFSGEYNQILDNEDNIILVGNTEIIGIKRDKINLKYTLDEDINQIDKFKDNILIFTPQNIDIFQVADK